MRSFATICAEKQSIEIKVFLFFGHCVSLSAVIVNKKIRGAALGAAVGAFFAFIFQTQHPYLHYSKREVKYVNVILFRIACYTHNHK